MMFGRLYKKVIIVGLAMALGACVKDDHAPEPEPTRVLLVYVGTDNNLSGLEQQKLSAIREGWSGRATDHIVAYIDDRGGDARLIEISNLAAGESPRRIASYGTENSAAAATLARVIADVTEMYPADSYGLLVFSHASGWLPQGIYSEFSEGKVPEGAVKAAGVHGAESRSIITDGRSGDTGSSGTLSQIRSAEGVASRSIITDGAQEMELKDLAIAIPDGVFDYIAFEACFMAGIEVAYELRAKAPLIFASSAEIVNPGFGPIYSTSTVKIMAGNLPAFGESAFSHTLTYAETNPQRSATYSVIRTAPLDALAAFVRTNCDFSRSIDIADVQRFDRLTTATLFYDFQDYHARLLDTDAQRAELARLIADCIEWKQSTEVFMTQGNFNGFTIDHHSGLTTYIEQAAYPGLSTAYGLSAWYQATR